MADQSDLVLSKHHNVYTHICTELGVLPQPQPYYHLMHPSVLWLKELQALHHLGLLTADVLQARDGAVASKAVRYACRDGNRAALVYLHTAVAPLSREVVSRHNWDAVAVASYCGHLDILTHLIKAFQISATEVQGCHALRHACAMGHLQVVSYLVLHVRVTWDLEDALRYAVHFRRHAVVMYLCRMCNVVPFRKALREMLLNGCVYNDVIVYLHENQGLTLTRLRDIGGIDIAARQLNVALVQYWCDHLGLDMSTTDTPCNTDADALRQSVMALSLETTAH